MTPDETTFFHQLGLRIAEQRKAQGLTQAHLGELVGATQQQIASFEIGRRRIRVSTLPLLAKALGVSIETLVDGKSKAPGKRGPVPRIQRQLQRVSSLPKPDQQAVMRVLDSMLAQVGR
jgi:transcriptional regulator with XRE-family HTH domain